MTTESRAWSGKSHGGGFGHWLVGQVAKFGGIHLCYLFIIPPTLVLFIRLHQRRRAALNYWRRMRPDLGRWGRLFMAWRQFYSFARLLADRFIITAAPNALTHRSLGYDTLAAGMRSPTGCIVMSAHVGNWELSGRFIDHYALSRTHIVMLEAENPAVAAQVRAALKTQGLTIIDLTDPFNASLKISAALRDGDTCCMLGDRSISNKGNDKDGTIAVPFLGGIARFPTGPFIAAATTGAVIVPTFCLKFGWKSYITLAFGPWHIRLGSRKERGAQLYAAVAQWAHLIEVVLRRFPLQWHNFYPFWNDHETVAKIPPVTKSTR
jgi:predicted LPLAT superfamily acyltransferase